MEEERKLCLDCQSFYGTKVTEFRCSSCFKKYQDSNPKQKEEEVKVEVQDQDDSKQKQENRERCWNCNKKCGISGIECKCGYVFCSKHRLPESHDCIFDHSGLAKQNNTKKLQNGHTQATKLQKIDSTTEEK